MQCSVMQAYLYLPMAPSTAGLGALNVVGVATLAGLLADAGSRYVLYANGMGWVAGLMPALQVRLCWPGRGLGRFRYLVALLG